MSEVRAALEDFAAGELDYAELQRRLNAALSSGVTVEIAVSELDTIRDADGLSAGLYNVLRRAITRVSDGDDTSPFPGEKNEDESTADLHSDRDKQTADVAEGEAGWEIVGENDIDAGEQESAEIFEAFQDPESDDLPQMFTRPESLLEEELPEIVMAESEASVTEPEDDADGGDVLEPAPLPSGNWLDELRPVVQQDQETAEASADEASDEMADKRTNAEKSKEGTGLPLPEGGELVGERYVIQSILGRGGMGIVYRVQDRCRDAAGADNPDLAMKILKPELEHSADAERRLLSEALQGQNLHHPNLVRIFDLGRADGRAFMTMELLDGESLRSAITRHSPDGFPPAEALPIIRGMASGLAYLHQQGYVHSDFKPGNVFLSRGGEPKLLDFGLARRHGRAREPMLDGAGLPARTPAYASPQVLAGSAPDFRDDVFSLACVAYELIAGRHPFGRVPAKEASERKLKPARISGISAQQRQALKRSLSFEASRRPADANAFLAAMGLKAGEQSRLRPGFLPGILLGLAAGILLTLAIISPDGPVYRLLADLMQEEQITATGTGETSPEPALSESAGPSANGLSAGGTFGPASAVEDLTKPREPLPLAKLSSPADEAGADQNQLATDSEESTLTTPGDQAETDPARVDVVPGQGATSTGGAPEQPVNEIELNTPAVVATTISPPPPETGPGRLQLDASTYRVAESSAVLIARVIRTGGSSGRVAFFWRTMAGSATAEEDYIGSEWQRVELGDGELSTRLFVPLVNDGRSEDDEVFIIELADPEAGARLGPRASAEVIIADDDSGP